jgi:hypothetical protein
MHGYKSTLKNRPPYLDRGSFATGDGALGWKTSLD